MALALQQLINGLTLGAVYGLIAIGYTMVYGIIGMINFAHGDIYMVSAFIAVTGFTLLAAFGVKPVGKVLLDEKLGLHIAFGRSEHFGGQVGPDDFSSPDAVVHIDRVYVPETQPDGLVKSVDLIMEDGNALALMRDGQYVVDFC